MTTGRYTDLLDSDGGYIWGAESYCKLRPEFDLISQSPVNLIYIPYAALTTNYVANLLLTGYAASISSFAWGGTRVFLNLCVLGDSAGITVAYCINCVKHPLYFESSGIASIQSMFVNSVGARINK